MNTEQLINNLDNVRGEARGIVDNIKAVKGEKHAALTMGLVHASSITDVFCILKQSSSMSDEVLERFGDIYLHHLHEMLRSLMRAGGLDEADINAAIQDAIVVEGSVQSMARTAWEMAEVGKSYGGTE